MEGDKGIALMAKEMAEKKLLQKDLGGARILATKAQNLYPNLDGVSQLLATIDVYVAAEKRVGGEVDWYGVLGAPHLADDEMIRGCYRKMALTLHPDKNKSVGADGAFYLVSQAWTLLSDKSKRTTYDQKYRLYNGVHVRKHPLHASQNGVFNAANNVHRSAAHPNPTPRPAPVSQNSFSNTTNRNDSDHRSATHPNPTPRPSSKSTLTFWTICDKCRTNFEYLKAYLNCTLVCARCKKSFLAIEVPIPYVYANASSTSGISQMKKHNLNSTGLERNGHVSSKTPVFTAKSSVGPGPFPMPGGITNVQTSVSTAAGVPGVCRMASENLKRKREEAHFGKTHVVGSQKYSFDAGKVNVAGNSKPNGIRDISQLQMKNILMEKARKEIRKKLDEWNASRVSKNLNKSKNTDKENSMKDKEKAVNVVKPSAPGLVDSETNKEECIPSDLGVPSLLMSVPDPDFHDFDGDRIESTFGENQVWAVYDDDDGMPRYYAFIHCIISKNPFRIRISWLTSKSNDEFAPINWVASGFPKSAGDLRLGKRVIYSTLNSFSHRVKWTKGSRGIIHIYPKKGDVWALYRNWSPDWDVLIKDDVIHKYDMVEVLEDYSEDHGVNVAPLVKVKDFTTVFCQNADPRKIRNIPKEEMFRFSHQVPSYLLTGEEGQNAPKGFLELDPASTPMELLQAVVNEAPEQDMETMVENSLKDELRCKEKSSGNGFVERSQTTKKEGFVEDVPMKKVAEVLEEKVKKPAILHVYKRKRPRKESAL